MIHDLFYGLVTGLLHVIDCYLLRSIFFFNIGCIVLCMCTHVLSSDSGVESLELMTCTDFLNGREYDPNIVIGVVSSCVYAQKNTSFCLSSSTYEDMLGIQIRPNTFPCTESLYTFITI